MRQTKQKHRMTSKEAISFALFVLLRRKNFSDITIGDIVERANVSRMTFYRYFKNKEDVFVYFTDERFEEFMNTLSCTKFSVNTFTHTLLRFVDKHKPSIELLIKCGCENLLLKQFDNYIAYIFRSAISKNSIYINNKYITYFISGAYYNVVINYVKLGIKENPDHLAKAVCDILKVDDNVML